MTTATMTPKTQTTMATKTTKTTQTTKQMTATNPAMMVNGINIDQLKGAVKAIQANPAMGQTTWNVTTQWMGGTRSDTHVKDYTIGGQTIAKDFTIKVDEPHEICGTNQYPNPQETLMAAMNACMMATYVAAAAINGVELEDVRIETEGNIDLRGFLGIDAKVPAGYDEIRYTVFLKGKGTEKQFQKIHEAVMATSPNYYNIVTAIPVKATMVVE